MKLNYKRTILIGFAFLSISSFWQMYDNIIPLILKNRFDLGETVIGFVMGIDNILALFLLPLFGTLSDKTNTRLGKRIPFILAGTLNAVSFMMLLPWADHIGSLSIFSAALAIILLAMALYRSPAVALMPDLTPKPLRSKSNAVINLMGAIGAIYTLAMTKILVASGDTPDYFPLFISIGLVMILSLIILLTTVPERKLRQQLIPDHDSESSANNVKQGKHVSAMEPEIKKSLIYILISIFLWFMAYNAVTSAFSRYASYVWGLESGGYADCLMVATITAIISYLPIGIISSHIGRKKTILCGVLLMTLGYLGASFLQSYHDLINIGFGLIGISWAAISVNSLPMVVEMASSRDVGKYTSFYYTFSMLAQALTPLLSGVFLEHISYWILFPYAVVFSALAFITMTQVRHGDSKPMAKKDLLESFDVDD